MAAFWYSVAMTVLAAGVHALPSLQRCTDRYPPAKHTIPLYRTTLSAGGNFEADITTGSQTVRAVLDTGSSNTWFMQTGFQCLSAESHIPISSDLCGFQGTSLAPSSSFQGVPNTHANLSYGSGESIVGMTGSPHNS